MNASVLNRETQNTRSHRLFIENDCFNKLCRGQCKCNLSVCDYVDLWQTVQGVSSNLVTPKGIQQVQQMDGWMSL